MRNIVFLLFLLLLGSCTSRKSPSTYLELNDGTPIVAKEYENELIIKNPYGLAFVNGKLLLLMASDKDVILELNKDNCTVVGRWGIRGNGPGEFNFPTYWGHNESKHELYLYDGIVGKFHICSYQVSGDSLNFVQTKEIKLENKTLMSYGAVLDDNYMVASTVFSQNAPIVLLDSSLNIQQAFGRLPGQSESCIDMRSYAGAISSYANNFAFGMKNLGYLAFYSQKDTLVQKKWEIFLEEPIYSGEVLNIKKLKQGFVDIKVTKNYVFCSYSGQLLELSDGLVGNNILVFDHNGNLIHNLKLDREIGRIAVSDDEKTVYAVAYEPDVCIVRYTLDDL